jgi:DMSO/TMAO reductase YedYZ molybdopterin-dependent catalytic subunit
MAVTRGFTRRDRSDPRLPPGQYNTGDGWPVLSYEPTPRLDTDAWTFTIDGLVQRPQTWSWPDLHKMPPATYRGAIHCVTTWSKFDMTFDGVSVDTLLDLAGPRPEAAFVMARSHTGYTTNLPLSDMTGGKAWVAWTVDGKPLPVEHGGPARLLVPHLYFWKSAKWVSGLTLMDHDEPGLWERSGYHDRGDPWLEQRYQGD